MINWNSHSRTEGFHNMSTTRSSASDPRSASKAERRQRRQEKMVATLNQVALESVQLSDAAKKETNKDG